MATLADYAHHHFPEHPTHSADGSSELHGRTAVAHVIGRDRASALEAGLRRHLASAGADEVAVVELVIEPTEPTVVNTGGEDTEGIVDLPHRRVLSAAIVGALSLGLGVGILAWLIHSATAGLILGAFAATLGGVVGASVFGGARYGGERAWEQPHAPDQQIVLVAASFPDEHGATDAARLMANYSPQAVRILDEHGAWHSPTI